MITLKRFRMLEAAVQLRGYGHIIAWSEVIAAPATADEFADHAIYVICNSGMRNSVARPIYQRCMDALRDGRSATEVFGHPGKAPAIDQIWSEREELFAGFDAAEDKLEYCEALPWIGPVTKYHLAKNLGVDAAKPDVHLERLAQREKQSVAKMCARLRRQTGYRLATIDSILWRACADGILDSKVYLDHGWRAAFRPDIPLPVPQS